MSNLTHSKTTSRRQFLAATSGLGIGGIAAIRDAVAREPIERTGPPRFRIGLSAYSFRRYFEFSKGKPQSAADLPEGVDAPATPWSMTDFLDYCVSIGVDAAELTAYYLTPGEDGFPDDANLLGLKRSAFERGVAIVGSAIGNDFTVGLGERYDRQVETAKLWIRKASVLGAPHIRLFAGTADQLAESPTRIDEAIAGVRACAEVAAEKGVMLGVENHGNLTADQVLQIMSSINSPWVGVNLDSGNFFSDTPYDDLRRCAPYAVNVQVKTTMRRPSGEEYPADLDRVAAILRDVGYQGDVVLEYEHDDPFSEVPAWLDRLRRALAG